MSRSRQRSWLARNRPGCPGGSQTTARTQAASVHTCASETLLRATHALLLQSFKHGVLKPVAQEARVFVDNGERTDGEIWNARASTTLTRTQRSGTFKGALLESLLGEDVAQVRDGALCVCAFHVSSAYIRTWRARRISAALRTTAVRICARARGGARMLCCGARQAAPLRRTVFLIKARLSTADTEVVAARCACSVAAITSGAPLFSLCLWHSTVLPAHKTEFGMEVFNPPKEFCGRGAKKACAHHCGAHERSAREPPPQRAMKVRQRPTPRGRTRARARGAERPLRRRRSSATNACARSCTSSGLSSASARPTVSLVRADRRVCAAGAAFTLRRAARARAQSMATSCKRRWRAACSSRSSCRRC